MLCLIDLGRPGPSFEVERQDTPCDAIVPYRQKEAQVAVDSEGWALLPDIAAILEGEGEPAFDNPLAVWAAADARESCFEVGVAESPCGNDSGIGCYLDEDMREALGTLPLPAGRRACSQRIMTAQALRTPIKKGKRVATTTSTSGRKASPWAFYIRFYV